MSSDADIISRLEKLSIQAPEVIQHATVKGGQEWKAELEKIGKGDVAVTKTVSWGLGFALLWEGQGQGKRQYEWRRS